VGQDISKIHCLSVDINDNGNIKTSVFEVLLCAKTVQVELHTNSSLILIEIL
jgi:hypothetical protein